MTGDELRQRFETLETEEVAVAGRPGRRRDPQRGRRRRQTVRAAGLLAVALLAAATAGGIDRWSARSDLPPGRAGADHPADPGTLDHPPVSSTVPPTSVEPAPRTTRTATGAAAGRTGMLRVDGLGGTAFGTAQGTHWPRCRTSWSTRERRSWASAQTPFGTCGPVRAARWGRLYVLFTSGPTRYRPGGAGLFAYQVDAVQRSVLDGQYSGPTPPTRRRCVATARGPGPASGSGRRWPSCGGPTATR